MIRAVHKNYVLTEEGEIVDTNTGVALRTIVVLVCGTAVLMILLQVVEGFG